MLSSRHFALVCFNQFNPFVMDGASQSLLAFLRFIQSKGEKVSLINYVSRDLPNYFFIDTLADIPGAVTRKGDTCRAVFRSIPFFERILPFGHEIASTQAAFEFILQDLGNQMTDFVWTADESYIPLLAVSLLNISGAHFFNSMENVQKFARQSLHNIFLKNRTIISNSRFLQEQIKGLLNLNSIIWQPLLESGTYRVREDKYRTFTIGFYAAAGNTKGTAIVAIIIARLPECSFVVVGRSSINFSGTSPKNINFWGHLADMKPFYKQIDILLAPSIVEEAFGRVILEAAVNGIPTIANKVGGIPEALGDSGIMIDYEPQMDINAIAEKYVVEIKRLLDDPMVYEKYRSKALARAETYLQTQQQESEEIYNKYFL